MPSTIDFRQVRQQMGMTLEQAAQFFGTQGKPLGINWAKKMDKRQKLVPPGLQIQMAGVWRSWRDTVDQLANMIINHNEDDDVLRLPLFPDEATLWHYQPQLEPWLATTWNAAVRQAAIETARHHQDTGGVAPRMELALIEVVEPDCSDWCEEFGLGLDEWMASQPIDGALRLVTGGVGNA